MLQELDRILFNKDFSKLAEIPMILGLSDVEYTQEQLLRGRAQIFSRLSETERLTPEANQEIELMIDQLPLRPYPQE
jgi:hypothetical protein